MTMTFELFDGNVVGILDSTVLGNTTRDELGSRHSSCDGIMLSISLESLEGISVVVDGPIVDKRDGLSEVKLGKIDDSALVFVGIFIFEADGVDDGNDDRTSLSL